MGNSSQRGRPPKEVSASEFIPSIRVITEQKLAYKSAAKEAGMSLSGWLKSLANSATGIQATEIK